jgi:hypothetical protein
VIETNVVCALVESELCNRRVARAWLGYGDPLFLEFSREMDGHGDGAVTKLHTNFAVWAVRSAVCAGQECDEQPLLEAACQSLVGAVVQGVAVSPVGTLTIDLDGSRALKVTPWPREDGHSDAWCLGLSNDRILAVSNAGQFVVVDRDCPTNEWFKPKLGQGEPSDGAESR